MRLSPGAFNAFIGFIGQAFIWRRSYACPCVSRSSGQPLPDCPLCSGKGIQWAAGVPAVAGIANRSELKKLADLGDWHSGDLLLSIPSDSPLYGVGQFDRVTPTDRSEPFSVTLLRGINDRLPYHGLSIDRVFWLDDSGATNVEGGIPTVSDDGILSWSSGAPPEGASFSVSGRRSPDYFVYNDMPFDRPEHFGAALPRRVIARRYDLFGR